ncbi:type VI secretion system tip protein VgrG [Epibacterium sp. SM1979]|uniref:Type VI secretion system tip protein VgrG n=1 Tax=Tritonibacter litoralis TaxID=2662264 RepID=A0A843YLT8_9RHOB|nr:type VI secretion system tip protein TssI/VgrG [Tritonibacter litoralis]MQQ10615.1 type VI secretion system tip protein VgrG [Tritonibacter litoralis]
MNFIQSDRHGSLTTQLGKDILVLNRFDGSEEMSGHFEWHVEAISQDPDIDLNQLLGTHATVSVKTVHGPRYFDGIATEARWGGTSEQGNSYDLVLRPWLHLAGLRRNQRIFHNKTVTDILTELFTDYASLGAPHFDIQLADDYPTLEYTVQYGESDAVFAMRMMERFGISWHWQHSERNHCLVLTDYVTAHADLPGGERPFYGVDGYHQDEDEHFREWKGGARMQTGAVRLTDYNFKTPNAVQEVEREGGGLYEHGKIESFDYPGDYLNQGVGETVVSRRAEMETGGITRMEAKGNVITLGAGLCVTPVGNTLPGATGRKFLCLRAEHALRTQAYATTQEISEEDAYQGRYVLSPADAPMRPERRTQQVVMKGPQTAVVVGDGEIDVDEYGRILVQFHWDLEASYSMRCRLSQNWSGNGWGGMVIPRIGMEVMVEFLDGDPDKPLVTGCVFNGKNKVPYSLPEHKTKSVFRTDTHRAAGFNEMVFEDEPGHENIAFKAQKDMSQLVLNDSLSRIKRHDVQSVGSNQITEVGQNQKTEVGGSVSVVVGGTGPDAAGLLSGLSGLAGITSKLVKKGAREGGGGGNPLTQFADALGKSKLGFLDGLGALGRSGLLQADESGKDANNEMRMAGSKLGSSVAGLFDAPGTMNTLVSNFRSDSTGVVSAEQVGLTKIVNVGGASMEQIGKAKQVTIGEKLMTTVGKMILSRTKKHTIVATEKFTISAPGGSIEIDAAGMTIKATKLKVLSGSVDFDPGAPSQSEVLKAEEAFCEECQASVGG